MGRKKMLVWTCTFTSVSYRMIRTHVNYIFFYVPICQGYVYVTQWHTANI